MFNYIRHANRLKNRDQDQSGASAVEYGLLVAGIAALVVAIVFVFGGIIKNGFQGTCNRVKQGSASAAATC